MSPPWLTWLTVTVVGFVACAEFGSYAFVHPVIRRLPPTEQVRFEKGLLTTFGRVMPVGMTATPVLIASWVATSEGVSRALGIVAGVATAVPLATTITVNVDINRATGSWDPERPPADWLAIRRRWDRFQGIRSWLLLVGFLVVSAAVALGR